MRTAILLYVLLLLLGCQTQEFPSKKELTLEGFHSVILDDAFTVILTPASEFSVQITAFPSSIDLIQTSIVDSILTIENKRKFKWTTPANNEIQLEIKCPNFKEINTIGACNISSGAPINSNSFGLILGSLLNIVNLELDCQTFYYWNNGPSGGSVSLSGYVNELKIWNHAIMQVNASQLQAQTAQVFNGSKGDVSVAPVQKLEYELTDIGNLILNSSPETIIELAPNELSGSLIHED